MRLAVLSGAFTLGLAAWSILRLPWEAAFLFTAAAAVAAGLVALRKGPLLLALVLLLLTLGLARASILPQGPGRLFDYHGLPATLQGIVASDPQAAGAALSFRLEVQSIQEADAWRPTTGAVHVTAAASPHAMPRDEPPLLRYGDLLTLHGVLEAPVPLEDFDYPAYLAQQGISSVLRFPSISNAQPGHGDPVRRALSAWRLKLAEGLKAAVSEPQSSVDRAMLLGLRGDIPANLTDAFRRTGTSHLLAISGLHVGIVMVMLIGAVRLLAGRRWGLYVLIPLLGIWLYAALSGMAPPVWRAAVMGSLYLWSVYLGRPRSAWPAIGAAAAVMLALDPNLLRSVSFQLSFAAVIGLATLHSPIQDRLDRWLPTPDSGPLRIAGPAKASLALSLAAVLATAPLVALHFQQVSTVGIPTTLLALPAMPIVLLSSLAAAVGHLVLPQAGIAAGWLAWLATSYVTALVELLARLPGASFSTGPLAWPLAAAYYAALAGALLLPARLRKSNPLPDAPPTAGLPQPPTQHRRIPWALAPLAVLAAAIWTVALAQPPALFQVTVLDVGQGDAIFIQTPEGHQVLVDGGPSPLGAVHAIGERMPFWDRSLDAVVLTHPDADHLTGLIEVLLRYQVGSVLIGPQVKDGFPDPLWQQAIRESGAEVVTATSGQRFRLGQARADVLNPPQRPVLGTGADVNNAGVVLRLSYGAIDFLLLADMEQFGEHYLANHGLLDRAEVVKVAHHGSATSSTPRMLDHAAPQIAVISAGADNAYGHPAPAVLDRLESAVGAANIYTTANQGNITFSTDGARLWVDTQR